MTTDISTPITFAQEVTDKVRQLIMNAMPEEKVQAVLKAEYDKYFTDKPDRWNNPGKSPFSQLVESEVKRVVEQKVREEVNKYLYDLVWENNGKEHAEAILAEITPAVMHAMAKQTALNVARTFVSGMPNLC
jgi:hypothetical protein